MVGPDEVLSEIISGSSGKGVVVALAKGRDIEVGWYLQWLVASKSLVAWRSNLHTDRGLVNQVVA